MNCDNYHDKIRILNAEGLDKLFAALRADGYTLLGPTRQDQTILCAEIEQVADLPQGWTDRQEGGSYRLESRSDGAYFGYQNGPRSWKHFLYPPQRRLFRTTKTNGKMQIEAEPTPAEMAPKLALIGVHACDLAAIRVQDKVFMTPPYVDPDYAARRQHAFILAVNCTDSGDTCFCSSMGTGPEVAEGADLALTELIDGKRHVFLVGAGTEKGRELLDQVPGEDATKADLAAAKTAAAKAARQGRKLDTDGLKELLQQNLEHAHWQKVSERCLGCTNCTMVCPTCFCATVEEVTDLDGTGAERWRYWDSCFSLNYSYIHGGSMRHSPAARYRQWLTHKLANWHDQFDTSGCVGCGRCITWCPVGIDLTEEAAAIRTAAEAAIQQKTSA